MFYLVWLVMLITPSVIFAAPTISTVSGSLIGGAQVTISGSNFGHSGPNVVLYDDFSEPIAEGEEFSTTAVIGNWAQMRGRKYSDSLLSNGQGARLITEEGHIQNYFIFPQPESEVFVSSYAYVPTGYRFPAASLLETMPTISALKHHWLYYGPNGYGSVGHDNFGPNWTGANWHTVTSNKSKTYVYQRWGNPGWEWGKPVRWSHWLKGNGMSQTGTKGAFQGVTSTGQVNHVYEEANMNGKVWFVPTWEGDGMPYAWDRLSLVGYFRGGAGYPTDNYVIDDVYLAVGENAAARIEFGNAPVYADSTKLTISTPDNWSDTEIIATIREGRFVEGELVYLFIIDRNNKPSIGYGPMSFGSDASIVGGLIPPPALRLM